MTTPKFSIGDILANYSGGIHKKAYEVVDNTGGVYKLKQIPSGNYFTWNYATVERANTLWTPTPAPTPTPTPKFSIGDILANYTGGIHKKAYEVVDNTGGVYKLKQIPSGNYFTWNYATVERANTLWTPTPAPTCPMPSASMSLVSKDGMTVTVKPSASPGAGASWKSGSPYIIWYDGPNVVVASGNEYTHTYSREGHFTIVLVAENTCGKGVTKSIYVTATKPPSTHNPPVTSISLVSKDGLTVVVNAQASPGSGETWASGNPRISWGDSAASTYHQFSSGNLSHTFAAGATYHIRIVATNAYGLTTTTVVSVTVTAPPPMCAEGTKRGKETCWNGYVIYKEVCAGGRWVPTGQTCLDPAPTIRRLQGKARVLEVQVADLRMKIADLKTRYGI